MCLAPGSWPTWRALLCRRGPASWRTSAWRGISWSARRTSSRRSPAGRRLRAVDVEGRRRAGVDPGERLGELLEEGAVDGWWLVVVERRRGEVDAQELWRGEKCSSAWWFRLDGRCGLPAEGRATYRCLADRRAMTLAAGRFRHRKQPGMLRPGLSGIRGFPRLRPL